MRGARKATHNMFQSRWDEFERKVDRKYDRQLGRAAKMHQRRLRRAGYRTTELPSTEYKLQRPGVAGTYWPSLHEIQIDPIYTRDVQMGSQWGNILMSHELLHAGSPRGMVGIPFVRSAAQIHPTPLHKTFEEGIAEWGAREANPGRHYGNYQPQVDYVSGLAQHEGLTAPEMHNMTYPQLLEIVRKIYGPADPMRSISMGQGVRTPFRGPPRVVGGF